LEEEKFTYFDAQVYDKLCGQALVEKGLGLEGIARKMFSDAIRIGPNISVAWVEIGLLFGASGNPVLAHKCLVTASRIFPEDDLPRSLNLEIRASGGRFEPIRKSISLDGEGTGNDAARDHQRKYKRKLYDRYYELETAKRRLRQAIAENPGHAGLLLEASTMSVDLLDHKGSIRLLQAALALRPDDGTLFVKLVEAQVKGCIFDDWDANFRRLAEVVLAQVRSGTMSALGPIQSTMYPLDAEVSLAVCSQLGEAHDAAALRRHPHPLPHSADLGPRRILRVAYMTSHFTSSSIGREMLFLLAAHDPGAVHARCYALNADEGSWLQHTWRAAIARACHSFADLSPLDDGAAAAAVNRDGAHVLVDLNGWSGGHRAAVVSLRPAPVQVNYKNWVASSGIPGLGHNVGDRVACPPDFARDYTEALVLVPHSYFISGHAFQYPLDGPAQRAARAGAPPAARAAARRAAGLPGDGFLVASFNSLDKLEPRLWRLWRALLDGIPGSALWLLRYPPAKAARVAQLAAEDGLAGPGGGRLVVTGFAASDEHIGVKALADVFVDSPAYNAHSTAMDTLWGGLPLATAPGRRMAARVGASLCLALAAPHTVARGLADARDVVLALARAPLRRRALRRALERARRAAPLFDTVRAVRNLETALRAVWDAHAAAATTGRRRGGKGLFGVVTTDVGRRADAGRAALEARLAGLRVESAAAERV
jgi:protein O-GlcNAc transferase